MSTMERKEYQETKIMRTVSPVRNFRGSSQNLAEFDSNLGYLLEDLQNSVSRPSSSLGSNRENYRTLESSKTNSLNRITNVKASNPVTEYASDDAYNYSSPDSSKRVYKKEIYSYKTSGSRPTSEKSRMQNSINQLDTLLDDLKQVKNGQLIEKESYNTTGTDPDSHTSSSRRTVHRELHYGDTPRSNSKSRSELEESLIKDIQHTQEGNYGDIRQIRGRSPSPSSKSSTLTKQTKVTNVHNYPMEVVETTTPDINPEILAHLDPNLHPPGNTKVTTTIKTYTYEIPGSGNYPTNLDGSAVETEKYVYSPNQSHSTPSKSFVYKKIENKSSENTVNYPYEKPIPSGGQTVVKETVTTRNYQPGFKPAQDPNWNNQTYIYNETTTTKNNENISKGSLPRNHQPVRTNNYIIKEHNTVTNRNVNQPYPNNQDYPQGYPPRQDTYIIKEIHDTNKTNVINYPYSEHKDPTYPPPTQHYIKEIHDSNTTNNIHHGYPNGYPQNEPGKTVVYRHETRTTNNYGPGKEGKPDVETFDPHRPPYSNDRKPNEPVNIQYRYKSESTTTNNYKTGYPPRDESEPLLPRPFPTDNNQLDAGPPKKLDELMANIGNEPPNSPYNAGFTAHEIELEQQKKIETLKRQQKESEDATQNKDPVLKSKNVSGPPVYYPPGHEMFAKKEESGAWRAEGGYEKASGKYKYEAQSGSKSKSSSGAAIVPVCLPLCCGLPCTIL